MKVFQIRKGKKVLDEYLTEEAARKKLAKQLYYHPKGLSLVKVVKK